MSLENLINKVNDIMEFHILAMDCVRVEKLGLDPRSGWEVCIDHESIVVRKENDRTLQYYGGFSYVDKDYRMVFGNFVVYSSEDSRVAELIDCWTSSKSEPIDV